MRDERKVAWISMDSRVAQTIAAQKFGEDGLIMLFKERAMGLYRHDTANTQPLKINNQSGGFSFVNTVEGNKHGFTQREIERANQSTALYCIIRRPAEKKFYTILAGNQIINCPITVADAKCAFYIYGPDMATL